MRSVQTILADDHRIYIEGLKAVFARHHDDTLSFQISSTVYSGAEVLRTIQENELDLLIMDLNLPGKDGLEVLDVIQRSGLSIRVIVLTIYDDPKIIKAAFKKGVDGYLLKNRPVEELFRAIKAVLKGESFMGDGISVGKYRQSTMNGSGRVKKSFFADRFIKKHHLTKREVEILHLITQALSNKEIAHRLFISDQTVSVHRKNIMRKLGVSNTAGLIKLAYEYSLV